MYISYYVHLARYIYVHARDTVSSMFCIRDSYNHVFVIANIVQAIFSGCGILVSPLPRAVCQGHYVCYILCLTTYILVSYHFIMKLELSTSFTGGEVWEVWVFSPPVKDVDNSSFMIKWHDTNM